MAAYVLNQLNRANYQERQLRYEDGNEQTYYEYVAPEAEAKHLASMQELANTTMDGMNLRVQIAKALGAPEKSSSDFVARSVTWAREINAGGEVQPDFDNSILISAALVMRDGNTAQRMENGAWADVQFKAVTGQPEDPVNRQRSGLLFNPIGSQHPVNTPSKVYDVSLTTHRWFDFFPGLSALFCETVHVWEFSQ
jgi:hypothetical protein